MQNTVKASLIAGILVPFFYYGAQLAAAPFFPDFSFAKHTASILGSDLSSRPYVLNTGAFLTGIASLLSCWGFFYALRKHQVWIWAAIVVAFCSLSFGAASIWAATQPMPDIQHNPGALGLGMFAMPFITLLVSFRLKTSTILRSYFILNVVAFFVISLVFSQVIPVDLQKYEGAVQRLASSIVLIPMTVLALWLFRNRN